MGDIRLTLGMAFTMSSTVWGRVGDWWPSGGGGGGVRGVQRDVTWDGRDRHGACLV